MSVVFCNCMCNFLAGTGEWYNLWCLP